uniref:Putative deaminase n=1 Tax=Trypanosoma congolense (strain IL3000) TaxID=1068625 RepID=G0US07_TRYCI|nr:putative deaminase [Trypanosoma congolense IL3000]
MEGGSRKVCENKGINGGRAPGDGGAAGEAIVYCDFFMRAALAEAARALEEGEVPVGCVFVRVESSTITQAQLDTTSSANCATLEKLIVARGRNATNRECHSLAHAEFAAVDALMRNAVACAGESGDTGKSIPASLADYVLYVAVEPCIMCAAMLLYNQVKKVYFGCGNPRFGGNGTVLRVHMPCKAGENNGVSDSIAGYESCGGYRAEEAVALLQRFYSHENANAPPGKRKRKGVLRERSNC